MGFVAANKGGYVNTKGVHRFVEHGEEVLLLDQHEEQITSVRAAAIDSLVVSIIPVQGKWSMVYERTLSTGKKKRPLFVEPLISWGLTLLGSVIPMTPSFRKGEQVPPHGLWDMSNNKVYGLEELAEEEQVEAWLSSLGAVRG